MPRSTKPPAKGKAKGALPRAKKPTDPTVKAAADRAEARATGKKPKAPKPRVEIDPPIKSAETIVKEAKRRGAPSLYTEEIATEICEHIIEGGALVAFCRQVGRPSVGTVYRWIAERPDFRDRYVRAREDQADTYADEIAHISDTEMDPQRARVRIDARKWVAAKLKPKKYSDHLRQEHTGKDGGPIETTDNLELARWIAYRLTPQVEPKLPALN